MSTEVFSAFPPQERIALVDLVETESPDASRAFAALTRRLSNEVGGRRRIANEAIVPMTIPDPASAKADEATRLLVVSEYRTPRACLSALAKRSASASAPTAEHIRSYATRPWSRLQAGGVRAIMKVRGCFGRARVPRLGHAGGAEALEALVRGSAIHDALPAIGIEDARWGELVERAGDRPIWMLNFLRFRPRAIYSDLEADASDRSARSGAQAYALYGRGMFRSITRVGGHVAWISRPVERLPETRDADWDQIAIAFYPSPAAMLSMLGDPEYKAAHVHRVAGLERTRLLATQPLAGV